MTDGSEARSMTPSTWDTQLDGMLGAPPRTATGGVDPGRFSLSDVQATVDGSDVVLTCVWSDEPYMIHL